MISQHRSWVKVKEKYCLGASLLILDNTLVIGGVHWDLQDSFLRLSNIIIIVKSPPYQVNEEMTKH